MVKYRVVSILDPTLGQGPNSTYILFLAMILSALLVHGPAVDAWYICLVLDRSPTRYLYARSSHSLRKPYTLNLGKAKEIRRCCFVIRVETSVMGSYKRTSLTLFLYSQTYPYDKGKFHLVSV